MKNAGDMVMSPDGKTLYIADTWNNAIRKLEIGVANPQLTTLTGGVYGKTDGILSKAEFKHPQGIEVDKAGYIYVSEKSGNRIRVINPN